jgi:hypothetical protein
MNNVQNHNSYIKIPSSQTYTSYSINAPGSKRDATEIQLKYISTEPSSLVCGGNTGRVSSSACSLKETLGSPHVQRVTTAILRTRRSHSP